MSSVTDSNISLANSIAANSIADNLANSIAANSIADNLANNLAPFKHPKLSAKFNLLASFICFLNQLHPDKNLLASSFLLPFNLSSLISILQNFDSNFATHSLLLKNLSRKVENQKKKKAPSTKNNKLNDNTNLNEHSDLIATLVALANSSDAIDINAKPTALPVEKISSPTANVTQASTNAPEKAKRKYTRKPKIDAIAISEELANELVITA